MGEPSSGASYLGGFRVYTKDLPKFPALRTGLLLRRGNCQALNLTKLKISTLILLLVHCRCRIILQSTDRHLVAVIALYCFATDNSSKPLIKHPTATEPSSVVVYFSDKEHVALSLFLLSSNFSWLLKPHSGLVRSISCVRGCPHSRRVPAGWRTLATALPNRVNQPLELAHFSCSVFHFWRSSTDP